MRKLSGWARLWIVVAVPIWGYGGWLVLRDLGPPPRAPLASDECVYEDPIVWDGLGSSLGGCTNARAPFDPNEVIKANDYSFFEKQRERDAEARRECESRRAETRRQQAARYDDCVRKASHPEKAAERQSIHAAALTRYWSNIVGQALMVTLAPVALAIGSLLLFRIGRWVWRGFRPET